MTGPSHQDILEAVKENSDRLAALEIHAAETRGAMKFGRAFFWSVLAIGGFTISLIKVLQFLKS